jgi:hypothetical protein
MKPSLLRYLSAASLSLLITPTVFAGGIALGDLVVVQVGTGTGALAAPATASFLDEYTISGGSQVQQITLPTSASGLNDALTLTGNSTSEGFLSLSADGNYLTLGGYNQTVGGATSGSTAAVVNRVIGLVSISSGAVDTTTAINSATTTGNIRSAATVNGTSFYEANSSSGVGYVTFGAASAATQLSSAPTNVRVVKTAGGQLYTSSASGAFLGVATIGTGLPTTSGQTTTALPGFPTTGTHSSYDYWFKDANTLYVADDGTAANGGGIQKWTFNGTTWSLQYTLLGSASTTVTGVRGLTGFVDGGGNVELFGTTAVASGNGNALIEVTDTGATAADTVLETAGLNTVYRGVAFVPSAIPEPSTLALLGLGCAMGARFFGRRKK